MKRTTGRVYLKSETITRKQEKLLHSIDEYWVEDMPTKGARRFSIARFYFSAAQKSWAYDGTNFKADGTACYSWSSFFVIPRFSEGEIYYAYRLRRPPSKQSHAIGFGSLRYKEGKNKLILTGGFFVDCEELAEQHQVSMASFAGVVESLGLRQGRDSDEDYSSRVVQALHQVKRKNDDQLGSLFRIQPA